MTKGGEVVNVISGGMSGTSLDCDCNFINICGCNCQCETLGPCPSLHCIEDCDIMCGYYCPLEAPPCPPVNSPPK